MQQAFSKIASTPGNYSVHFPRILLAELIAICLEVVVNQCLSSIIRYHTIPNLAASKSKSESKRYKSSSDNSSLFMRKCQYLTQNIFKYAFTYVYS